MRSTYPYCEISLLESKLAFRQLKLARHYMLRADCVHEAVNYNTTWLGTASPRGTAKAVKVLPVCQATQALR